MSTTIYLHNTLSRKKEAFTPQNPPHVGLYVCGPTVYGEPHLGHVRMAINFDILHRYLKYAGYKVRYVRNITDVGHLEDEVAGVGEDRIAKKAKLEQLEPMEVVQKFRNMFTDVFRQLNILPPSIEPQASGHIIEQQEMIKKILAQGYAYEADGSVYFDIEAYNKKHHYGILSGRNTDDMLNNTRSLDGQSEKRNPLDFALWKKAAPEHVMRWPSDWSDGFPGWHLECSAMGTKYLGETFDIHGGGLDLMFPHHECEIAQSVAANGKSHVKYWLHNNMVTIDGQKMAKSLNNFITLRQLFSGEHERLERAYSPMTLRIFVLMAHYRSTLDFSNEALQAAEKGLERLTKALETLDKLKPTENSSLDYSNLRRKCEDAMNDDLNTPIVMAHLFDMVKTINSIAAGSITISNADLAELKSTFNTWVTEIMGIQPETLTQNHHDLSAALIETMLDMRLQAKKDKNFALADEIRNKLQDMGISIKDTKDGFSWELV